MKNTEYRTDSGIPLKASYSAEDLKKSDYSKDPDLPGEYPYTRGVYPSGYRTKKWVVNQLAMVGTAEDLNRRWKWAIKEGNQNVNFYVSPKPGLDADDERLLGFIRNEPVINTTQDIEDAFQDIDLDKITVTINSENHGLFALFIAGVENLGWKRENLQGTLQSRCRATLYPEGKSNPYVSFVKFCTREIPKWNSFWIDMRQVRDSGVTAVHEAALTIAHLIDGVRICVEAGLNIDEFGQHILCCLSSENDFFEEVAKFRAIRRMWATVMKERYGAKNPKTWRFRFHCQTTAISLPHEQPLNNLIRSSYHALAGVLGGCQSLGLTTFDEPLATPSEFATLMSTRTQQILQNETGVNRVVDPLGGSYYVEWLTDRVEEEAWKFIGEIEKRGGIFKAGEWILKTLLDVGIKVQDEIQNGERPVVGQNIYRMEEKLPVDYPIYKHDNTTRDRQIKRLEEFKQKRDNARAEQAKVSLCKAWKDREDIIPHLINAAKDGVTLGEMTQARKEALGPKYELPNDPVESYIWCYW